MTEDQADYGIKGYIQSHPEEYKSEIHEHLFTEEEIKDMAQSLRRQ